MSDTIIEVHSLSSADGWYFEDFAALSMADLKAVVSFALVTSFDPDYPSLGLNKIVLPLSLDQVGQPLIGANVPSEDIVHESEMRLRLGQ